MTLQDRAAQWLLPVSDLTAAQERIQALEAQVGMLRGALTNAVKGEDEQSWTKQAMDALALTESQAAEVVRGMERVVEAVRRIDFPDGWSKVRDALAALEAVRGNGGQAEM